MIDPDLRCAVSYYDLFVTIHQNDNIPEDVKRNLLPVGNYSHFETNNDIHIDDKCNTIDLIRIHSSRHGKLINIIDNKKVRSNNGLTSNREMQQNWKARDNITENSNNDGNNNSPCFWIDDVWTESDEKVAMELLQQSVHKCRIVNEKIFRYRKYRTNGGYVATNNGTNMEQDIWDQFYQKHQNNFFKDRHYLRNEFPHEFGHRTKDAVGRRTNNYACLVEVGCGVGNTILPILEQSIHKMNNSNNQWSLICGLDLSPVAIDILKQDMRYIHASSESNRIANGSMNGTDTWNENTSDDCGSSTNKNYNTNSACQCWVDVCDISIPDSIPTRYRYIASVSTLLFCLSAIEPTKHYIAIQNAIMTLRQGRRRQIEVQQQSTHNCCTSDSTEYDDDNNHDDTDGEGGGVLLFRDYGRYDEAQLKLGQQCNKLILCQTHNGHDSNMISDNCPVTKDNNWNENQCGDEVTSYDGASNYSHFYRKHDGTKCYYFTLEDVIDLFVHKCHLKVLECRYIRRVYKNRSTNALRRRVWVQGRFQVT